MKTTTSNVLLAATVIMAAASAQAMEAPKGKAPKEQCYGIAKSGENSCSSANGQHSCSGKAKTAYDGQEFKDVPKGSCEQMNGSLKPFQGPNPKMKG